MSSSVKTASNRCLLSGMYQARHCVCLSFASCRHSHSCTVMPSCPSRRQALQPVNDTAPSRYDFLTLAGCFCSPLPSNPEYITAQGGCVFCGVLCLDCGVLALHSLAGFSNNLATPNKHSHINISDRIFTPKPCTALQGSHTQPCKG